MIASLLIAALLVVEAEAQPPPPPILLELFTSEGCSSCPPADLLLEELAGGELAAGVEIVPLSLHVDYWNHLGWRDPYSSADFSRRQESYSGTLRSDSVFTPQLVIDGESQVVGSDRRGALQAIERAARRPRASVVLEQIDDAQAPPRRSSWRVSLDAHSLAPRPPATYLFVAVTEDGLASSVSRGENTGRTLRHVAVVRRLRALGRAWLDERGTVTQEVTIDLDPAWRRDRLHVVAWAAAAPNGQVLGSTRAQM
jgi:hypothetical protein